MINTPNRTKEHTAPEDEEEDIHSISETNDHIRNQYMEKSSTSVHQETGYDTEPHTQNKQANEKDLEIHTV